MGDKTKIIPYEDVYWFFSDEYTSAEFAPQLERAYIEDISVRELCKRLQAVRMLTRIVTYDKYGEDLTQDELAEKLAAYVETGVDYLLILHGVAFVIGSRQKIGTCEFLVTDVTIPDPNWTEAHVTFQAVDPDTVTN